MSISSTCTEINKHSSERQYLVLLNPVSSDSGNRVIEGYCQDLECWEISIVRLRCSLRKEGSRITGQFVLSGCQRRWLPGDPSRRVVSNDDATMFNEAREFKCLSETPDNGASGELGRVPKNGNSAEVRHFVKGS